MLGQTTKAAGTGTGHLVVHHFKGLYHLSEVLNWLAAAMYVYCLVKHPEPKVAGGVFALVLTNYVWGTYIEKKHGKAPVAEPT